MQAQVYWDLQPSDVDITPLMEWKFGQVMTVALLSVYTLNAIEASRWKKTKGILCNKTDRKLTPSAVSSGKSLPEYMDRSVKRETHEKAIDELSDQQRLSQPPHEDQDVGEHNAHGNSAEEQSFTVRRRRTAPPFGNVIPCADREPLLPYKSPVSIQQRVNTIKMEEGLEVTLKSAPR